MDVERQIEYWIVNSEQDLEVAEILVQSGKILHGLFFCHLSLEKALKANVVKAIQSVPPRSHNLIYLSEKARLDLDKDTEFFFGIINKYQLEGRYPDYSPELPARSTVNDYLEKAKEILVWLKNQL